MHMLGSFVKSWLEFRSFIHLKTSYRVAVFQQYQLLSNKRIWLQLIWHSCEIFRCVELNNRLLPVPLCSVRAGLLPHSSPRPLHLCQEQLAILHPSNWTKCLSNWQPSSPNPQSRRQQVSTEAPDLLFLNNLLLYFHIGSSTCAIPCCGDAQSLRKPCPID